MSIIEPVSAPVQTPAPRARLQAPGARAATLRLRTTATWVASLLAAPIAVVACQGLASFLRVLFGETGRPEAWGLAWSAVGATALLAILDRVYASRAVLPIVLATVISAGALAFITQSPADLTALLLGVWLVALGRARLARYLDSRMTGEPKPLVKLAWVLLALVACVQTTRLSTYMTDLSGGWFLTTDHPWWADHMCSTAYFHAAELHQRGETNIYAAQHYPALDQAAAPETRLEHLDGHIEDPYQYPPTFLLYPLALMSFTSDFAVMRSVGFALQFLLVAGALAALFTWVGGRRGALGLWCLPLLFGAVPFLQNFQYGQFHLTTFALCLGALIAFDKQRRLIGGGLLALAIGAKLFPAAILGLLVMRRRWRDLAATSAMLAVLVLGSYLVLGSAPFEAFWNYQIPALQSGAAFAFDEVWPEMREPVLTINLSVGRLWDKLFELGLVGATGGAWLLRGYALLVVALTFLFARRAESRAGQALAWLGLLNLAVLHAGGGWADYVTAPSLLLFCLVASEARQRRGLLIGLCVGAAILYSALGVQPMPQLLPAPTGYVVSIAFTLMLVGVNIWMVVRSPKVGDEAQALLTRA